jgi:hypothetical protein
MPALATSRPIAQRPTRAEREWLARGLGQPGGKLPLFDPDGQAISAALIRACLDKGWAEPWFSNPLKPDWLVCKLTDAGRRAISTAASARADA